MADTSAGRRSRTPRTAAATAVVAAVVLAAAVTIALVARDDGPDVAGSTPSATVPGAPSAPPDGTGAQDGTAAPEEPAGAPPGADDGSGGFRGSSGSRPEGAEEPDGAAGEAPPLFGDQETELRDVDDTADFGPGVEARIVGLERIEASGTGVGQVAGEAVLVTLELANRRDEVVSLATTTVTAYGSDGAVPASSVDDERAQRLPAEIPPGGTAEGRYAFSLPPGESDTISVAVMLDLSSPVLIFEAPVPPRG